MLTLEAPGASAAIDAAHGGRVASLRVGGRELLLGPSGPADDSIRWGCYLMAPWPGRLADGRLAWAGQTSQLRRTHGRHAIHGLVAAVPWTVETADRASVAMSVALDRDGWPFGGTVHQAIRLESGRLVLHAAIRADVPMPAALGWHPWFLRHGAVAVRVRGDRVLELRDMLPTGRSVPATGKLDLRDGPALGRRRLDDVYVGVEPPIEITWPDLTLRLETAPWLSTVVVHTPARGLCIEPQTAWPNALGSPPAGASDPRGARVLGAGESLEATLTFSWRAP
jgi:aldose 1-epimerase